MIRKVFSVINLLWVFGYWIPYLIIMLQDYHKSEFLSGLTLIMITFSVSAIIVGFFGWIGLLKEVRRWMGISLFVALSVKHIVDFFIFRDNLFLYLSLFFGVLAFLFSYLSRYISPARQVLIINILVLLCNIIFFANNAFLY